MPRIRYTPAEKESALQLCDEIGVLKASEQTGISTHSLYKWRSGAEEDTAIASDAHETPVEAVDVQEKVDANEESAAPRKRYTAEQKEKAVLLCDQIGITKASRETGITITSLRKWRAEAQGALDKAADEPKVQELPAQNDAPVNHEESVDIIARLSKSPVEEKAQEEKQAHEAMADNNTASEELIRLRIENEALRAQILSLKGALRVFTE